jgi:hypothetical protein
MPAYGFHQRWFILYALCLGILGISTLAYLFVYQAMAVDLFTLLLFTVTAVVISSFQVPLYRTAAQSLLRRSPTLAALGDVELSMKGAILLGAMLVAGPSLGGWVAFITGLVTSVLSRPRVSIAPCAGQGSPTGTVPPRRVKDVHPAIEDGSCDKTRTHRQSGPWVYLGAAALLNGGRDVLAIGAAWWVYRGMGGTLRPFSVTTPLALALIVMCIIYALVRRLAAWLALLLLDIPLRQGVETLASPGPLAVELLPLPVALLVSTIYTGLGWSCFLMLAAVFIGLGAVMRQMMETIWNEREKIDVLELRQEVSQAAAAAGCDIDGLCALAYRFCDQAAAPSKFEIGLYNCTQTLVYIRLTVENGSSLPPMSIPQTPLWMWLSNLREGMLAETEAEIAALPFELPPLGPGQPPCSAIFVPLFLSRQQTLPVPAEPDASVGAPGPEETTSRPIGAIVLQSPVPNGLDACALARVQVITEQIGLAIGEARSALPE